VKITIEISEEAVKACYGNQAMLRQLVDIACRNAASHMLKSINESEGPK
jgi:hypothetical protein